MGANFITANDGAGSEPASPRGPGAILVTGGAGFIGSNFLRLVTGGDCRIVNLDLLTYAGNPASVRDLDQMPGYEFVEGDIGDRPLVAELLRQHRVSAVVNFAAESHVDRSIDAPDEFVRTNLVGTANLLKECLAYWDGLSPEAQEDFRFLHVSTDEVFGSLGPTGAFTEQTRYDPSSPYSASKAGSDHLVRAYHRTYGLPTTISNCSNNSGPFQFPEKLIPLVTLNAIDGRSLPVYGDGGNVRDWLYVGDHCQALTRLLRDGAPGETFNIGGGAERTNLEVVQTICDIVDELVPQLPHRPCRSLIEFVEDRPGHDRRYAIDASKIEQRLGWRPATSFQEGIRKTVAWYLDNSAWVEEISSNKYGRERLGLATQAVSGQDRPATITTFRRGDEIADVEFRDLSQLEDDRGWLVELFRRDELLPEQHPVMAYVSETQPGVVRGPHEHVEQSDYFAFLGPGDFQLYCWDARPASRTFGVKTVTLCGESRRCVVTVPPGVVHAYKNISDRPGWVFNAPNRLYAGEGKRQQVDEIRHEDQQDSPYTLD